MKRLNSLNHFDYFYNYSSGSYGFYTDDDVEYIITFLDYSNVMEVSFPVFSFCIDRVPDNRRSKTSDNKVRNTILAILSKFFENNQSALVAIYDSVDGKQELRKRLFDRWYNLYNDGSISKAEGKFKARDQETYAVAIYSSFHENCDEIEKQFKYLLDNEFYN